MGRRSVVVTFTPFCCLEWGKEVLQQQLHESRVHWTISQIRLNEFPPLIGKVK